MKFFRAILFPFSLIYGMIMSIRNFLYDLGVFRTKEFDIPIITVGNLNTGGTGKTPFTEYIVDMLTSQGKNPAVLSRGYKRYTKGFVEGKDEPTSRRIGDEPAQIKSKFKNTIVAVCNQRVRGVKKLKENHPDLDCIVMDDGFQHRAIYSGMTILLTAYGDLFQNDQMLPTGNLREPKKGAKRADIIVITKTPRDFSPLDRRVILYDLDPLAHQEIYFSYIDYGDIKPVFPNTPDHGPIELGPDLSVAAMTGIANPEPLYDFLEEKNCHLRKFQFQDHHNYSLGDIKHILRVFENMDTANKIILTTEKDAVRLRSNKYRDKMVGLPIYYLEIKAAFHDNQEEFNNKLIRYVNEDQRNDRVYPQQHSE